MLYSEKPVKPKYALWRWSHRRFSRNVKKRWWDPSNIYQWTSRAQCLDLRKQFRHGFEQETARHWSLCLVFKRSRQADKSLKFKPIKPSIQMPILKLSIFRWLQSWMHSQTLSQLMKVLSALHWMGSKFMDHITLIHAVTLPQIHLKK